MPKNKTAAGKAKSGGNREDGFQKAAIGRVLQMMAIPGVSGQEDRVVEFITSALRRAGVLESAISSDNAHRRTPLDGNVGNLILKLPGTKRMPRRLLMAHLDTVPICVGARPVRRGDLVHAADAGTGLGGDNRAGAAVLLTAAVEILQRKLPHPPLTFLWPVQEEVGLYGARHARLSALGKPRLAFNWDGGAPEKLTIGATGGYRIDIDVFGKASHAGGAPEEGVSAVAIAALAIAELVQKGWHGDIRKGSRHGTSNIGVIEGGAATNVVTDHVRVRAEARSHDKKFRQEIVQQIQQAFCAAAQKVRNVRDQCGRVEIAGRLDYEAFRLSPKEPCVLAAVEVIKQLGLEPELAIANGGLDANWTTARGIPTVSMGCGQMNIHTVDEQLHLPRFLTACRIALKLATSLEPIPS